MLQTSVATLSFLWFTVAQRLPLLLLPRELEAEPQYFTVRHAHASTGPRILFTDELPFAAQSEEHIIRTRPLTVHRPRSREAFQAARYRSLRAQQTQAVDWDEITVLAPDVEDRKTLLELAKMTGDAYALPGQKNWYEVDKHWNTSIPFGWEDDGLRGNIFVSADNSSVVLSIKGTSLFSQSNTVKRDKLNNNRLFSCCCARVDIKWSWSTVCDCFSGNWQCDQTCLERSLTDDDLFYNIGVNLYNNITYLYPDANIWLVGHSLGGAVASLLGATFGVPVVTYESPGERLAASRLHLPRPPPTVRVPDYHLSVSGLHWLLDQSILPQEITYHQPTTHVYNTADPVPQGICTGIRSLCAKGGYAMEARCHLGKTIVYDTVTKLGWRVDLSRHRIAEMIYKILDHDWEEEDDVDDQDPIRAVPKATPQEDCIDCFKWEFGDFKE